MRADTNRPSLGRVRILHSIAPGTAHSHHLIRRFPATHRRHQQHPGSRTGRVPVVDLQGHGLAAARTEHLPVRPRRAVAFRRRLGCPVVDLEAAVRSDSHRLYVHGSGLLTQWIGLHWRLPDPAPGRHSSAPAWLISSVPIPCQMCLSENRGGTTGIPSFESSRAPRRCLLRYCALPTRELVRSETPRLQK